MKNYSLFQRSILCAALLLAVPVRSGQVEAQSQDISKKPLLIRTRIAMGMAAAALLAVIVCRANGSASSAGSASVDLLPPSPPHGPRVATPTRSPGHSTQLSGYAPARQPGSGKSASTDLPFPLLTLSSGLTSTMTEALPVSAAIAAISSSSSLSVADWSPQLRTPMHCASNYPTKGVDCRPARLQGYFNDDTHVLRITGRTLEVYHLPEEGVPLLAWDQLDEFEHNSGPIVRDPQTTKRTTYIEIFKLELSHRDVPHKIVNATLIVRSWCVSRDGMYICKPQLFLENSALSAVAS